MAARSARPRTFKFRIFAERLEAVDIDIHHRIGALRAEPMQGESFFQEGLARWRELNTAEHFVQFAREHHNLCASLPLLVLHQARESASPHPPPRTAPPPPFCFGIPPSPARPVQYPR